MPAGIHPGCHQVVGELGYGMTRGEAGFWVLERGGQTYYQQTPFTNESNRLTLTVPPGRTALFHTHPNGREPKPGGDDLQAANQLKIPVFAGSQDGLDHGMSKQIVPCLLALVLGVPVVAFQDQAKELGGLAFYNAVIDRLFAPRTEPKSDAVYTLRYVFGEKTEFQIRASELWILRGNMSVDGACDEVTLRCISRWTG